MIDRDLEDQGAKNRWFYRTKTDGFTEQKPMVLEKPKHNQNETKQ